MREFFKNLYWNKQESLEKIDTFLDTFNLPKLNEEHIKQLNIYKINNVIKVVTKSL
jgi:hypothetical protein